jgi:transposase-like protein
MDYFSPHCPECKKNDEVVILTRSNYYYVNRYYCKRCKRDFTTAEGYADFTASVYYVTGGSVVWSGSSERFSSSE